YCDQQAVSKKLRVPVYAQQKRVRQGQSNVKAKRLTFASIAVVLLLLGLWFWYAWFARDPKVVYTVATPHPDLGTIKDTKPAGFYQLIGPGVLLSVKEKQLALYDVAAKKELWTARLQSEAEEQAIQAAKAKNEKIMKLTPKVKDGDGFDITQYHGLDPLGYEDDYSFSNPRITATTNDIWVSFRDRLMQFDRVTGNLKDPGIKGKIRSLTYTDDSILAVSSEPTGREVLTEIALPQGTAQTEEISPATNTKPALAKAPKPGATAAAKPKTDKSTNATANPISVSKLKAVTTQTAEQPAPDAGDDFDAMDFFQDRTPQFVAAGPNVVQFSTKLLEKKIIAHQAMKSKGKSIMDDNLTAGQSMDAAQEMLNDMQRSATGGVENEDVSRYQVTVHRRLAGGLPDWSGEVNGPPNFVALKTVDIVTAGNSITVLDKNNKKLWDAKLTYSVQAGGSYWDGRSPYLETKDSLYVADKGVLTRFDLATGNVRWRLNSVGISRIQTDTAGNLYLDTTSAGPETIKFSQEVNIHNKTEPVTMKVSATTGKVLWRLLAIGDGCIISGKFVYTTRISQQVAFLHLEDGPDTHYNLNLLKPSTGSRIWNYHLGNQPVMKTEIQKNWILIQTRDQVLVLKFFSL
ncbi:MAG: Pyrrolo-quinoline quinone, partial [Pedosphaera sp.]|nr:Pyrrolo-quinoline quinone [Pedosphaera sp.]